MNQVPETQLMEACAKAAREAQQHELYATADAFLSIREYLLINRMPVEDRQVLREMIETQAERARREINRRAWWQTWTGRAAIVGAAVTVASQLLAIYFRFKPSGH